MRQPNLRVATSVGVAALWVIAAATAAAVALLVVLSQVSSCTW